MGTDIVLGYQTIAPRPRARFLEDGPADGHDEKGHHHHHHHQIEGQQRIHPHLLDCCRGSCRRCCCCCCCCYCCCCCCCSTTRSTRSTCRLASNQRHYLNGSSIVRVKGHRINTGTNRIVGRVLSFFISSRYLVSFDFSFFSVSFFFLFFFCLVLFSYFKLKIFRRHAHRTWTPLVPPSERKSRKRSKTMRKQIAGRIHKTELLAARAEGKRDRK